MLFVGLLSANAIAQSLNEYKYVLVPAKFTWANEVDQYQLNSLTTFLFKKYGFEAYQLGDALPADLNEGGCNTLTADVEDDSGIIRTKLKVILKGCSGEIVYISSEGRSKDKEYIPAYHKALRDAFLSIEELEYAYKGDKEATTSKVSVQEKIEVPEASKKTGKVVTQEKEIPSLEKKITQPDIKAQVQEKSNPILAQKEIAIDRYISLDSAYSLNISDGIMVFYEGTKEIGKLAVKAAPIYQVQTTEFAGKGYFSNDQFIIEREIKGVQGIIKMIFEKE